MNALYTKRTIHDAAKEIVSRFRSGLTTELCFPAVLCEGKTVGFGSEYKTSGALYQAVINQLTAPDRERVRQPHQRIKGRTLDSWEARIVEALLKSSRLRVTLRISDDLHTIIVPLDRKRITSLEHIGQIAGLFPKPMTLEFNPG